MAVFAKKLARDPMSTHTLYLSVSWALLAGDAVLLAQQIYRRLLGKNEVVLGNDEGLFESELSRHYCVADHVREYDP